MFNKQMVKWTSFLVLSFMVFSVVFISSAANEETETLGLVQNTVNQTSEVNRALDPAMILKIDTEKNSWDKIYALPFRGATNVTVDYGNGVVMTYNTPGLKEYVYPVAGIYEIKITGTLEAFGHFGFEAEYNYSIVKLIEIISFGNLGIIDFSNGFRGANNLTTIPSVFPAGVTNTSEMFADTMTLQSGDISSWDVSSVTNMFEMFRNARNFNLPLTNWDVSNLTNMKGLFRNASKFNQPLNSWNTSKVTDVSNMFEAAIEFNQPLNNWNMSNVTNMLAMFSSASKFNQPLNTWDTSKVTNMFEMFNNAGAFNGDLDQWNTSNVTDMTRMFRNATQFNKNINTWDTSKVTNMIEMFRSATNFSQPLNDWNVSNVTNMGGLFRNAFKFNQPLDKWDVSKVTNLSNAFDGALEFNQPLDTWNVSNVNNMQALFASAIKFNQPLNSWDTSKVTNMTDMFSEARVFNYDLDNWNTSKVVSMSSMFKNAWGFNSNISTWDTSSLTGNGLFETFRSARAFNQNINSWNISNIQNLNGTFRDAMAFNQPLGQWNTSKVTDLSYTFDGAKAFNQDISSWNTSLVTTLFRTFTNAEAFNQPIGSWNTSLVTNMSSTFDLARAFNQNIDTWNTGNVTNMSVMFNGARAFNQPLGSWDTSKVTNFERMFLNAFEFNQPIGSWNTSNVTNMRQFIGGNSDFDPLPKFNQDISSWDFRKVNNMFDFMSRVELSPYDFDKLLQRFLDQTITLQANVGNSLSFSNTRYSKIGFDLRQQLITSRGWTIRVKGPLEVTISTESAFKTIGESDPVYTLKYTNLYKGDTASAVTGTYTITRAPGELVGSYETTLAGFDNEPYYYVVIVPKSTLTIRSLLARTLTFKDLEGNVLSESVFEVGDSLSSLVLPTVNAPSGYGFKEWSSAIPTVMPDGNLVLTPVFVENIYKLTFFVDGVDPLVYEFAYLANTTTPPDPTKVGHTFKAWDQTIPQTMPFYDLFITALFDVISYTINFESNLGTSIQSMEVPYNQDIGFVLSPTRTGYIFAGWSPALPNTMPAENLNVEALWTIASYNVTFDTAGGEPIQSLSVVYNQAFNLPTPTRTGYTFKGFVETKPDLMPEENLVFTATWEINQYTITFNTNGGTLVAPITLDFGSAITTPSNPTRLGYTFKSWSTPIPQTMLGENITISATWDINAYTITFNTNGGTTMNPITLDFGSQIPTVTQPTKEGYIFNSFSILIPQTMPAENLTINVSWIFVNVVKDDSLSVEVDGLFDAIPEALKTNDDISVSLVVELDEEEALNQSQQLIKSKLESNQKVQFLDIYVLLTRNQVDVRVSELTQTITVSLVLPENIQGFKGYQVVTVHNGVYRELETTFDEETQTVTFVTDKFSSYAIVYDVITTGPIVLYIILGISTLWMFIAFKRDRSDKDKNNKKHISDVISNPEIFEENEVKVLSRRKI